MDLDIVKEFDNKLLHRKEYQLEVKIAGAPPSRKDLKEAFAARVGAKPEVVIVDRIEPKFGSRGWLGSVRVYDTEAHLKNIELAHKLTRGGKKKKKGAAPAAPAKKA